MDEIVTLDKSRQLSYNKPWEELIEEIAGVKHGFLQNEYFVMFGNGIQIMNFHWKKYYNS